MNTNYFYLKYLYWDGYILHHDTTCFKKMTMIVMSFIFVLQIIRLL